MALLFSFAKPAYAKTAPEAFGVLPAVYDAAISPDAAHLALIINMDGQYGVRILNTKAANKKPLVVLLGDTAKPKWVKWVNNDRVLVAIWRSEVILGTPITSSYIITIDTVKMKTKLLVVPKNMFRQFNDQVIDFLPDDPKHILMRFSNSVSNSSRHPTCKR